MDECSRCGTAEPMYGLDLCAFCADDVAVASMTSKPTLRDMLGLAKSGALSVA